MVKRITVTPKGWGASLAPTRDGQRHTMSIRCVECDKQIPADEYAYGHDCEAGE
jgi:hypothetical protein